MGNVQTMKPETGLIKVPLNYPTTPQPGKLTELLENNTNSIYHRYSPYVDYNGSLINFGSKQPFIYTYIDEHKKGLSGLQKYESRSFPIASAPRDVVRISKFLFSGDGLMFVAKQFLLQVSNAFNETRIYNPSSPLVAAGRSASLGLIGRPQRNINITGGFGGAVRGLIGDTIPDFFGPAKINAPYGSLGDSLPRATESDGAKGLLRAHTANAGAHAFMSKWHGGGKSSGFSFKKLAKSLFGGLFPQRQSGVETRSDESAYGAMIRTTDDRFNYNGNSGPFGLNQIWLAGSDDIMRKNGARNSEAARLFNSPDGKTTLTTKTNVNITKYIIGHGYVGVDVHESNNGLRPGIRYGDNMGIDEEYYSSMQLLDYYKYSSVFEHEYKTKKSDKKSIDKVNDNLNKVLTALRKSKNYEITPSPDLLSSKVFPAENDNNPENHGYNRLARTKRRNESPMNYIYGLLTEYKEKNIRMVDNSIAGDPINNSLRFSGAGNLDAINTLRVLPKDKSIVDSSLNHSYWEPYKHDQIAFFFHDIVNEKYVPFRASVKGLTESSTANWEELTFIGRSDRLYSYGGFTRSLQFNFDIVISSVLELSPTWNRINYLMSMVKPAGYTTSTLTEANLQFNRFAIPPMIMLTIGDMYKQQPIMINTISIVIPEDAIWETINDQNSDEWSYLANHIKSNKVGKKYGQFPQSATISISCHLLEKERAIMGSANFGHAPHTDEYDWRDTRQYPDMHRSLVEYQAKYAPPLKPATPIPEAASRNAVVGNNLNGTSLTSGAPNDLF
jgi:hypothetical protein